MSSSSSSSPSTLSAAAQLLPTTTVSALVASWLREDLPSFDYGAAVVGRDVRVAVLWCKQEGVLAGRPFVDEVFRQLGCEVAWRFDDGAALLGFDAMAAARQLIGDDKMSAADMPNVEMQVQAQVQVQAAQPQPSRQSHSPRIAVAHVTGPVCQLLAGERTALNVLARASGVATRAARLAAVKSSRGWQGVVAGMLNAGAGTRKTTPGFRLVEKYAMLVGGVDTHRMDLSSMCQMAPSQLPSAHSLSPPLKIMLKDNHVWATGSITNAVRQARKVGGFALKVEVECRSLEEAYEAIDAGADVVMLDNFTASTLHTTAALLKQRSPHTLIEGSGGLTERTIAAHMSPHVDVLSLGALSQGVPHVDFSMKVERG